ncbi:hypothetical protein LCER1_G001603 [Lachnellula cervina]|uniref:Chitin-binding type-1 domain-containing protein n=1 Tax=Lachnellula cervina TaxID=1316786 RepID=A0A7D8YWY3_9HELO|nr:hypothetical protein LCER1_G001603 [Lachnellula cervina]
MQYTTVLAALALGATTAVAHMEMSFPPPLRSKFNTHAKNADYSMTAPLSGPAQFPCKGYQSDMSDTSGVGASVITWAPGAKANFTVVGGAVHGGGSCQASLSYDQGKSFTVIQSYIGNCPMSSGQNFDFTIPSDAKAGAAMFAWTWYNKIGNREIYMNCASVTIGGGSKKRTISERDTAFSSRPGLFVANMANGCSTIEGKDISFPDPGPDVTGTAGGAGTFTGTCAAVSGVGGPSAGTSSGGSKSGGSAASGASSAPSASPAASGGSSGSGSSGSGSTAPSASASSGFSTLPASSAAASAGSGSGSSGTASAPASSGTGTSGSLSVSSNGQCGGSNTCAGQTTFGACCSKWNFCGDTTEHCGDGCQAGFGKCGSGGSSGNGTNTTVSARQLRNPNLGYLRGRRARFNL